MRLRHALGTLVLLGAAQWGVDSNVAFAQSPQYLELNSTRSVVVEDRITKVLIDKGGVVDVQISSDKSSAEIVALGSGSAVVKLHLRNGKVETLRYEVGRNRTDELPGLLTRVRAIPGISGRISGSKIVATGLISTQEAGERFAQIKRQFPDLIEDNTDISYRDASNVANTINSVLKQNGMGNLQVRQYGKIIVLKGAARDTSERELALRIARLIDPLVEDGISDDMSAASAVNIDVLFIEASKGDDLNIGLQGGAGMSGTGPLAVRAGARTKAYEGNVGRVAWSVAPLEVMVNLIQARSSSNVLSNPRIVARSGQRAKFHSGGTVYLVTETGNEKSAGASDRSVTLESLSYGMEMEILPKVNSLGQIDCTIRTSVTEPLNGNASRPGTSDSSIETAVTLQDGYSVLLSGFKHTRKSKNVSRIPILSDIPVVGELFKSRRFQEDSKELLILLTTSRIEPHAGRPEGFDAFAKSASDSVRFSIFD